MNNKCKCCNRHISYRKYFCDHHWKLLDPIIRSKLMSSKKEETIQKNLASAIQNLDEFYLKHNPLKQKMIYYAHPIGFYFSEKELDTLEIIKKNYPDHCILNPNNDNFVVSNMEYFLALVSICDLVIAQPFDDGKFGAGVAKEVIFAIQNGIPVKELNNSCFSDISYLKYDRCLSIEETGQRNRGIYEKERLPEFGDYVYIEQKRYGCANEMYMYKVINVKNSNVWVNVPVDGRDPAEKLQPQIETVVSCIMCGIDETLVQRFNLKDVKLIPKVDNYDDD